MKIKYIFLILFSCVSLFAQSQEWKRIYGDNTSAVGYYLIENYDKGYIFIGSLQDYKYAWIIKTDINGYMLWNKKIGNSYTSSMPISITQTRDSGFVLCGSTTIQDSWYDAYIQKFNACAEPEWCRILNPNTQDPDYGRRIKQLADGGFILLTRYLGTEDYDRIHLNKLDENGNIIWQQAYSSGNWPVFNEEGFDLTIVNENRYLITGECYYPDPGDTLIGWRRPYFIMTDSIGNLVWETPWVMDGYYAGTTRASVADSNGFIYTAGNNYDRVVQDKPPSLLITSPQGDEVASYPLIGDGAYGSATTICRINDNLLLMAAGWIDDLEIMNTAFFKVDTSGNTIDSINIDPPVNAGIYHTIKTFDGKYVSVGTSSDVNWDMWAFKINENMEYDSIYTGYFEYDYICPDSIEDETYDMECDIVLEIDEPFTTKEGSRMKAYPNPATDRMNISLPEYIISESQSGNWDVTTVDYRYKGPALLEFYDNYGIKVYSMEVNSAQKEHSIDVSGWKTGLYVVVLMKEGKIIDREKVLVY